jgi:hypothetical protein
MATLTDTRINLADRHITLFHLQAPQPPAKPMPLGDPAAFEKLYPTIDGKPTKYSVASGGKPGKILNELFPAYSKAKFWTRYLQTRPNPSIAWQEGLPLKATITRHLEIVPVAGFGAKISPRPRIFLYPFGWSTSLDIRITGDHTISDLVTLTKHLFNEKAFQFDGTNGPISLQNLLQTIAEGVREDAFGGGSTKDLEASELAVVITVIDKHSGSPALGALTEQEKQELMFLVRPEGAPSSQSFDSLVLHFSPNDDAYYDLNYMVIDRSGRFTWMEKLLKSEQSREHERLECYHHNSVFALIQAAQFAALLNLSKKAKKPPDRLQELFDLATDRLNDPPFRNASVRAFLDLEQTRTLLKTPAKS